MTDDVVFLVAGRAPIGNEKFGGPLSVPRKTGGRWRAAHAANPLVTLDP